MGTTATLFGLPRSAYQSVLANPVTLLRYLEGTHGHDGVTSLYLEKDWHISHWALTGSAYAGSWPRNFLLVGNEFGPDLGDGPGRLLRPEQVREIASEIGRIEPASTIEALTLPELIENDIYPVSLGDLDDPEFEEWMEIALESLTRMQSFLLASSERGFAVAVLITP